MTRYSKTIGPHEVVVGWDRPLRSYFAQVYDATSDEDDCLFDYGANLRQNVQRLDDLAQTLEGFHKGYGSVVDSFHGSLHLDRDLDLEPR